MHWNFTPEVTSLLFLGVILLNTRKDRYSPHIKNQYFILLVQYAFIAVFVSIFAAFFSENHILIHPLLLKILVSVFYLVYSLMPYLVYIYTMATVDEKKDVRIGHQARIALVPFILFSLAVLSNFIQPWLFVIDGHQGYIALSGEILIFIHAYTYFIAMIYKIYQARHYLERGLQKVFLGYIAIMTLSIHIQQVYPSLILTGTGIALAILNIHLYIQNREIVTDPLTGLPNRKAFMDHLRSLSIGKTKAELILISLKDFKTVNDLYGQRFGDHMLIEVGKVLLHKKLGLVFRFSGDIFAIISLGSYNHTLNELSHLMERISDPWEIDTVSTRLGAHYVLVEFNEHVYDHEDAFALLEYFLAKLKLERTQDLILSTDHSLSDMHRHFQIIESLKTAVVENRFTIHIQPVYHRILEKYLSAEVLLRLSDPNLGNISPSEFIPLAESSGLMPQIGMHVTELSLQFLNQAKEAGLIDLIVSINFSDSQMNDPLLPIKVTQLLKEYQIDPSQIRIEITETVFSYEISQVITNMETFKEMGIYFYMDDFGTGYSNLSRVSRLPFELVKLDRSMVLNATNQNKGYELGKGLVQTFHSMGMLTIAEGIETQEQWKVVEDLGIDAIQGYLKCRPLPALEVIEFLKSHT